MSHEDSVFLKPEVKIEPLACGWYAWPHLVAPLQLAMNVKYRFLPLMQSFVSNPAVHVAANSDPKLFGGPFVSLAAEDVPQVRRLLDDTTTRCAGLLQLAQDLKALDAGLQEKANGYSLNEFYGRLPDSLRGLVEFTYDLNNHPRLRLFEELLYQDGISADTQQILLQPIGERARHFFMSTPRLETPDSLIFKLRFADPRIDRLAAARTQATSFTALADAFEVAGERRAVFRNLFTTTPPAMAADRDYHGDGVRLRYFGHACVLVQTAETSVLFDPTFALEPHQDGRYTFNDLPDHIDTVVLSHSHQDHCCIEMLVQLRQRIGRVIVPRNNGGSLADPSLKLILHELGYRHVEVADPFDAFPIPGGALRSLPFTGEHCDLDIHSKHAVHLAIQGRSFLFLVDSDGRDTVLYERMMRTLPPVDAVFLGMECDGAPLTWLYEPLLTKPVTRKNNESRRLSGANCERAWTILQVLKPPRAYVYAMGQEPWMRHIMGLEYTAESIQLKESEKLVAQCHASGIKSERLYGSHEMQFPPVPATTAPGKPLVPTPWEEAAE